MVAVTYGIARIAAARRGKTAHKTAHKAGHRNLFMRLMQAMMDARLRQAERELERHSHLLAPQWFETGSAAKGKSRSARK